MSNFGRVSRKVLEMKEGCQSSFACFDTSPKIWWNSSSNMESCNQIWIFFERRVWHSDGSTFTHWINWSYWTVSIPFRSSHERTPIWWKIQSRQRFEKKMALHKKILLFFSRNRNMWKVRSLDMHRHRSFIWHLAYGMVLRDQSSETRNWRSLGL